MTQQRLEEESFKEDAVLDFIYQGLWGVNAEKWGKHSVKEFREEAQAYADRLWEMRDDCGPVSSTIG